MAAIDFPNTPTLNQQVTLGGFLWQWNGEVWRKINAGKSAFAIAVDNGFTGTESQWLASLQGDDGVAGATGATGAAGATGPQGATGPSGSLTLSIRTVTASTALVSGDQNQMIRFNGTSAQVLTVDNVLAVGSSVKVFQDNSGSIDFQSGSGVTLLSNTGFFLSNSQNNVVEILCVALGQYRLFGTLVSVPFAADFLVLAGGGGSCGNGGNGGGAGGYRTSAGDSGGNRDPESGLSLFLSQSYVVTVGAGGTGGASAGESSDGSNSVFASVASLGGGGASSFVNGRNGGSGSGAHRATVIGLGTQSQGNNGGLGLASGLSNAGGGGGAQSVGAAATNTDRGGNGGAGLSSTITGVAITRGGGGGGGGGSNGGGTGGTGGGGNGGASSQAGTSGTVNTGGGAGGGGNVPSSGGAGGSGVVIVRYPSSRTISGGSGLTFTTATVGANRVTTFTAGTGNISFS